MTVVPKIYRAAFRRLREFRGFSQTVLAERMGLTKSTVSKIETGKQSLDALALHKMLGALKLSLTTFHRVCESVEDELAALGADTSGIDSEGPPLQRVPDTSERLRLVRHSVGPIPGTNLRLDVEAFLDRTQKPDDGMDSDWRALSDEACGGVRNDPDDGAYDEL